jgi:hypothetical protein
MQLHGPLHLHHLPQVVYPGLSQFPDLRIVPKDGHHDAVFLCALLCGEIG